VEILYLLIPLSLAFVALAVAIFFWAVKSGQFEDLEGPAYRILFDDEPWSSPAPEASDRDVHGPDDEAAEQAAEEDKPSARYDP
jgi:cbb3-type cytochrome oxidase maturation protein